MATYMKIGAGAAGVVEGNVTAKGFEKWIECHSVQWGAGRGITSNPGSKTRETSKASVSEVSISKGTDTASPALCQLALLGASNGHVTIVWVNSGGTESKLANKPYQTITLSDAIFSSYSQSSGGDRPNESVSINFTGIQFDVNDFDGKNVVASTTTYNLVTGDSTKLS